MTAPTRYSDTATCACGCGLPAPIAQSTDARRGRIKDQPHRFRRGHQAKTRLQTPASVRFWAQVTGGDVDECWIWNGYRRPGGWGVFNDTRTTRIGAHRFAYLDLIGPIPDELDLDHLCRDASCVNPWHMEPVPRGVNVARANAARRHEGAQQR